MKLIPSLSVFPIISLLSTSGFALNLSDAPIQHVTLYPSAAKIERSFAVKAGEQMVILEGLAANFDISELQYQSSSIEVNAVSHQDSALGKPSGLESQQLKTALEQVQAEMSAEKAIIQAAELQNKFLVNQTKGSGSQVRKLAYDAFVAIDQAKQRIEKLQQRSEELSNDLNKIGDHQFNQRKLKFYVNASQQGVIKISYIVPYARWQPIYKAELDSQSKQLKLTRMAMIAQKTGEDWNNVKLTLSTTQPQTQVRQISPEAWRVNYYQPEPVRPLPNAAPMYEDSRSKKSIQVTPLLLGYTLQDSKLNFPQFSPTDSNFSTAFNADTQTSLASSRQEIYLPLSTEQYPVKVSIWAIPKQSTQAMINAELPAMQSQWPAGTVKLYRDGDYIGERNWQNQQDEILNMNFGYDDQIQIKVIDLLDKRSTLSSSQVQTLQKKQYQLQNLHAYPINVKLFDSAPQSQNSQLISQSSYSLKPTATQWQGQPDMNQWELQLAPKQKFELQLEHQFKYPSKGRTTGF